FPAIVVVVNESAAPSRTRSTHYQDLGGGRDVLKRFPTLVAKQGPDLSHQVVVKDIHPTVVVIILRVTTHRRYSRSRVVIGHAIQQARFLKSTVPLIQVEKVGLRIVGDKNIHPSVFIEICNANTHSFTG